MQGRRHQPEMCHASCGSEHPDLGHHSRCCVSINITTSSNIRTDFTKHPAIMCRHRLDLPAPKTFEEAETGGPQRPTQVIGLWHGWNRTHNIKEFEKKGTRNGNYRGWTSIREAQEKSRLVNGHAYGITIPPARRSAGLARVSPQHVT